MTNSDSDNCSITILRPYDRRKMARKMILEDGTIKGADNAAQFTHETRAFEDVRQLHDIVFGLLHENAFVVRAAPATDRQPIHRRQAFVNGRDDNGFVDASKRWLAVDIDGVKLPAMTDWREDPQGAIDYVIGCLPEAFWDVSCSWSFSGSHGLEKAGAKWTGNYVGDVVRVRLWFMLDRGVNSSEAQAWLNSMSDLAPVDASVARIPQPIYLARPATWNGVDPLARLGVPLGGFREGLEDVVVVPGNLEQEARWARAEGAGAACASHPSADAAIAAIGKKRVMGGRPEIRSHMMSAALHLARNERKAKRDPKPEELHAAILEGIERHRVEIEGNLKAAGRSWSDVAAYTDTGNLIDLCRWAAERIEQDNLKAQDGGGGRKLVTRLAVAPEATDGVVFLSRAEAHAIGKEKAEAFVGAVREYAETPKTDEQGNHIVVPAPQLLNALPTGGGKTHAAIEAVATIAGGDIVQKIEPIGPVGWMIPNLTLGDEAARRIKEAAPHLDVVVRRGRDKPDPDQPGQLMCHRIEDAHAVMEHGLSVGRTLCRFESKREIEPGNKATGKKAKCETTVTYCPFHGVCGYTKQADELASADVVIMAHAHLFLGIPSDVPKLAAAVVDESAWGGAIEGTDAPKAVGLGVLTSPPTLIDGMLRHARVELGRALEKEPDGAVRREVLAPFVMRAEEARKHEWSHVRELDYAVTNLTGEALRTRLRKALGGAYGTQAVKRVAGLWKAVEMAGELPEGARSGHMWLYTIDKETGAREVRMSWKQPLAAGWEQTPLLLMDATADVAVLSQVFTRIQPSPRYAVRNQHVKVTQVIDRAFSHATLVGSRPNLDPDGTKKQTAQRNASKVKARLIADALERYGGQDVLAVVPLKVEEQWRQGPLPPWLKLMHHGATVGIDAYGSVRAVYVVGRNLPEAGAVERMAGALTGKAVEEEGYRRTPAVIPTVDGGGVLVETMRHPDQLAEAIRRQVTEAGLVQAAGRIRAINRTAENPADIHLWCDVPVPDLGRVEAMPWQGPTIDETMLADGCWLERAVDAVRVYPDLGSSQAVEKGRKGAELSNLCLKGLYRQKLETSPITVRYRTAKPGAGAARAVFLVPDAVAARQFLEEKLGPLAMFEVEADPTRAETAHHPVKVEVVADVALAPLPSAAVPEPRQCPQETPQVAVDEVVAAIPAPPAPVPPRPPQPVSGPILTSPLFVSPKPQETVSRRFRPPASLMGGASTDILNSGFRRGTPTPWPTWVRP